MSWSDEQLIEAQELAEGSAKRILGGQHPDWIEDLTQETLIKLSAQDPADLQNWKGWIVTAARNLTIDALRREQRGLRRQRELEMLGKPSGRHTPSSGPAVREDALRRIIDPLSDRERALFVDSVTYDMTNEELADLHGYENAPTVAVILTRLRKKLRSNFSESELRELIRPPSRLYDPDAQDRDLRFPE